MWFSGMCRTFKNSHGTQETTWTTLYNLGEDELQNCHFGVPGLFAVTHLVLPIFVWFEEKHYTSWGRRQEIPFKLSIVCNSPPLIQHIWTFFWFSDPWRGWRSTAMPRCFFFLEANHPTDVIPSPVHIINIPLNVEISHSTMVLFRRCLIWMGVLGLQSCTQLMVSVEHMHWRGWTPSRSGFAACSLYGANSLPPRKKQPVDGTMSRSLHMRRIEL